MRDSMMTVGCREGVVYDGELIELIGCRAMLERDVHEIPDLRFGLGLLVGESSWLAAQLMFDCHPSGSFLGLPVDGRRLGVHRERVLPILRRQDRGGPIGDRQGGRRAADVSPGWWMTGRAADSVLRLRPPWLG